MTVALLATLEEGWNSLHAAILRSATLTVRSITRTPTVPAHLTIPSMQIHFLFSDVVDQDTLDACLRTGKLTFLLTRSGYTHNEAQVIPIEHPLDALSVINVVTRQQRVVAPTPHPGDLLTLFVPPDRQRTVFTELTSCADVVLLPEFTELL